MEYMRTAMHYGFGVNSSDQDASEVANYLTSLFGPDSVLPKSPENMPGYKDTVRPFSNDSLNIVYVEYDMPGPSRMPFSAAPDKKGYMWIPNFGVANKITRLDPNTGEMQDFSVPNVGPASIHSAVPSPDGSVWRPSRHRTRSPDGIPIASKLPNIRIRVQKHTIRVDPSGTVWVTGSPFTKFDPETKKFTHFEEVAQSYDVKPDKNGDVWFTSLYGHTIGKVDGKTMKVTQWAPPTPRSGPRRMEIAPDGMIWFDEFNAGKIARFDPKTETFTEYPLPGPDPTPYALGFDGDGYLWYNSHHMDVIGRFDTKTGRVTEYPFPHAEVDMREFFRDSQGRIWYASNPNNKVGYFYLSRRRRRRVTSKKAHDHRDSDSRRAQPVRRASAAVRCRGYAAQGDVNTTVHVFRNYNSSRKTTVITLAFCFAHAFEQSRVLFHPPRRSSISFASPRCHKVGCARRCWTRYLLQGNVDLFATESS